MVSASSHPPENEDSIARLIRDARGGSQQALGRLLETYRDYLLLIAHADLDADLRPKGGASDLVQETFLEAQRDFERFLGEDREAIQRWLRELLKNNLSDFVRRHRLAERRRVGREHSMEVAGLKGLQSLMPCKAESPSEHLAAKEQGERLIVAIDQLTEDYREVIQQRHMLRLPWSIIAERMGRSEGAVQKLWMRALAQLRRRLSEE